MIRPFTFLLALAFLSVSVKAGHGWASMTYDAPTGNVTFTQEGASAIYLLANSGVLNLDSLNQQVVEPVGAFVPNVEITLGDVDLATWSSSPSPSLAFERLTLFGTIKPNTPVTVLAFGFTLQGESNPRYDPIIVTPEPSTAFLAAVGAVAFTIVRRRK